MPMLNHYSEEHIKINILQFLGVKISILYSEYRVISEILRETFSVYSPSYYVPPTEGEGDMLLLVWIPSASA